MRQFLATESGSAGLLLLAGVAALIWSNAPFGDSYFSFWARNSRSGRRPLDLHDLRYWIDEALMAMFFS